MPTMVSESDAAGEALIRAHAIPDWKAVGCGFAGMTHHGASHWTPSLNGPMPTGYTIPCMNFTLAVVFSSDPWHSMDTTPSQFVAFK